MTTKPTVTRSTPESESDLQEKTSASGTQAKSRKKSLSMHEDIPVWHDCCVCEAEPYWEEAMAKQTDKESKT